LRRRSKASVQAALGLGASTQARLWPTRKTALPAGSARYRESLLAGFKGPTAAGGGSATKTGNVQSSLVIEASGLAASRKNANVLWVHNDSGDSARVFAMPYCPVQWMTSAG
jgi:hypothetical protein